MEEKNALDFELITDLFVESKRSIKIIISMDKGYDAAINKGIRNSILVFRRKSLKEEGYETFFENFGERSKEEIIK